MYIFKFKRLVNSITMWQKKEKTRQREIATLSESREGELVFHTKKKKNSLRTPFPRPLSSEREGAGVHWRKVPWPCHHSLTPASLCPQPQLLRQPDSPTGLRQPGPFSVGIKWHPVINPLPQSTGYWSSLPVPRSLFLTICNPFRGSRQEMAARKTPAKRNWWAHLSSSSLDAEHLWDSEGGWASVRG